jgi:hypothetical protein
MLNASQGPWLQLPVELLESLLLVNTDPATLRQERHWQPVPDVRAPLRLSAGPGVGTLYAEAAVPAPTDALAPPPIDPGIFRSIVGIRRLVDDASELAVRAAAGIRGARRPCTCAGSTP